MSLTPCYSDATSATLKPNTPSQDTPAISAIYKSNIASINTAVTGATASIKTLLAGPAPAKRELALASRQATVSLPGELALIIEEIGGALNEIIATLGLSKRHSPVLVVASQLTIISATTLSFLGPLVTSLGELVASLIPVVNNLLAVVEELLDGILGGLSAALLGLEL